MKTDEELLALLEKVKNYKMSPEEQEAQRLSWVVGELMLEHPELTREEAVARYEAVRRRIG